MKRSALKRGTKPLKRSGRLKARKRGSLFPNQRDDAYRRAVRAMSCLLRGRDTTQRLSMNDTENIERHGTLDGEPFYLLTGSAYWHHVCWGPTDAAHIGPHQASGAPDRGHILPLCRAAHQFYDEHRMSFYRATGYSDHHLRLLAREFQPASE